MSAYTVTARQRRLAKGPDPTGDADRLGGVGKSRPATVVTCGGHRRYPEAKIRELAEQLREEPTA